MSMCDDPPQRKKSTHDFAGFASVGAGNAGPVDPLTPGANRSAAAPMVDAVRKARRFIEGRNSGVSMRREEEDAAGGDYYARTGAALSAFVPPGESARKQDSPIFVCFTSGGAFVLAGRGALPMDARAPA
jgi:hypothetical protein